MPTLTDALVRAYHGHPAARALLFLPARLHRLLRQRPWESDRAFLRRTYRRAHGVAPDLDHPSTFTEKVVWRMLHDRNPLFPPCSDKLAVRDRVAAAVGSEYLVPLVAATTRPEELVAERLPARFVLKATHGSGWVEVVADRERWDRPRSLARMRRWLATDFSREKREWQYRSIPPHIVVEEMLVGADGEPPLEVRSLCFDGEPRFLEVVARGHVPPRVDYYDTAWNHFPVRHGLLPMGGPRPRPAQLDEIVALARRLSAGFDFVRVDLYLCRDRVHFGELTFTPGAAWRGFRPSEYDGVFGGAWVLPGTGSQASNGLRKIQPSDSRPPH